MATVRELVTIWGFDIDDKPIKNLEKGVKNVTDSLKVAGAIAIGAGAALFGMAKSVSLAGREISDTAKELSIGTDALQEYRAAGSQLGLTNSEIDSSFKSLKKTMGEARLGYGSGRTGVELLARETGELIDLNGTQEQSFDRIVNSLSKVKDETKRAAIAEQFFGGAGAKISAVLKNGTGDLEKYRKEFRELGGVMNQDTIKASIEFERAQKDILTILTGLRNEIGGELLPIMVDITKQFKQWFKENREIIKQNLKKTIQFLVDAFMLFVDLLKEAWKFTTRLTDRFGGLEKVAQTVLKVFAAIMALKLASGFGTIILSAIQFIGVLRQMGMAALIAQAKLLLIPLAIAGIVAAIALIAEDFVSFTEGRDSVIGRMLGGFDMMLEFIRKKMGGFASIVENVLVVLLTPIRVLINGFRNIGTAIDILKGKVSVLAGLKKIGGRFLNSLGFGIAGGDAAGFIGLDGTKGADQLAEKRNAGVGGARTALGTSKTSNQTKNQIEVKADINVTGLPPEEAKQAARLGIADAMAPMLRQTQRDLTPAVER